VCAKTYNITWPIDKRLYFVAVREKQDRIRIDRGFSAKSVGASVRVGAFKTRNTKRHS